MKRDRNAKTAFQIKRAVMSSCGECFCLIKNGDSSIWISVSELVSSPSKTFASITNAGIIIIANPEQTRLKREIQDIEEFHPALVATQPGWVADNVYVHPNGEVLSQGQSTAEAIVTFTPNTTYSSRGKQEKWSKSIAPFIHEQPILSFLLAYGFAAPLIKFVRPSIQNLSLELVGNREAGKTTAAILVGSIFGGDDDSDIGIGRSANMTKQSLKSLQRMTNYSLLFLDETNIMDKSVTEGLGIFFEQTSSDERARYGSSEQKKPVKNSLIMTGNVPLEDCASVPDEILEAARSRNISIRLPGSIFKKTPNGFKNNGDALGAMRTLAMTEFGTPIRKFIEHILIENERDPEAIANKIARKMARFEKTVPKHARKYNRLVRACALVYAAGSLAAEWNILPIKRKSLMKYCLSVLSSQSFHSDSNVKRLINLIDQNKEFIIQCSHNSKNIERQMDKQTLGFCVQRPDQDDHFYFIQGALKRFLGPDATTVLKALRDQGVLIGENGKNKKLCSHAPRHLGFKKRVYKVVLTRNQLAGN